MCENNDIKSLMEKIKLEGGDLDALIAAYNTISENRKTPIGLNRWQHSDKPSMAQFNEDNRIVDEAIRAITKTINQSQEYITVVGEDKLLIEADCIFNIPDVGIFKTTATTMGAANLDSGVSFTVGKDYYIYICDNGGDSDEAYIISLNSTFPNGRTAGNSRKIGGFHYGMNRKTSTALQPLNLSGTAYGAGWESNVYSGIVPRSVWTLTHRPKSSPEGMVYLGGGTWVDIYLNSDNGGGGLKSTFNSTPMTGTEGANWYTFNDKALVSEKRLMSYNEFCQMAMGSPQGLADSNANAWSATTNTGRQATGYVANAVSSIGCRDAVGNVYEWLSTLVTNASGRVLYGSTGATSYTYTDGGRNGKVITTGTGHGATTRNDSGAPVAGGWGWDAISPLGNGFGNIYEYYDYSLIALIGGGSWSGGVRAGCRAVDLSICPWDVFAGFGCRLASDTL